MKQSICQTKNDAGRPRYLLEGMVLFVVLIAAWLRLSRLGSVPPGMWFDEAYNALEALGLLESRALQVFFSGNNGREAMLFYLLAIATRFFGTTLYSVRFVVAMTGILTVPLLFRLTTGLFKQHPYRCWLGLVASVGLATSFWHLGISRVALRVTLLLPFVILYTYLFYRGLETRRYRYFIGAGLALGLSQYTYLSARLLLLTVIIFGIGYFFLYRRSNYSDVQFLWQGIALMGLVAGVIFLPLGLFFYFNPDAFSDRVEDVAVSTQGSMPTLPALAANFFQALRLFVDAGGILPRYTLVTRPLFDWLSTIGFWVGIIVLARRFREPAILLILSSMFVAWLPGLLTQDPVQELRQLGVLPFYYIVMAVGFMSGIQCLVEKVKPRAPVWWVGLIAVVPPLLFSGLLTGYDYFYRWANDPETYARNQGGIYDIAQLAADLSETTIVILPFETYSYPSARFLLHENFEEKILDATELIRLMEQKERVTFLGPVEAWPPESGLAWLTRDESANGVIYISNLLPQLPFEKTQAAQPILDRTGQTIIGHHQYLDSVALKSILAQVDTTRNVDVQFADLLRLVGYHLTPPLIKAGGFAALDLYWQGLNTRELDGDVFLQLVSADGTPVTQMHERPFSSEVSRWHWDALIPGRYLIWTGSELAGGPYVIQGGLFNPDTQERFDVTTGDGQPLGDQVALGLLYVSTNGSDPRLPEIPFEAELENGISLIGYSFSRIADPVSSATIKLHWYSNEEITKNYRTSVELLDDQGHIVSHIDAQPLTGLYPTSRWQPGEIVVDQHTLPLDQVLLPGKYRLELGMIEMGSGTPVPIKVSNGVGNTPDQRKIVIEVTVP